MDINQNNLRASDIRIDLLLIANMIPDGVRVLDVGCGDGELLNFLRREKNAEVRGIELSPNGVNKSVAKGLSVIQGNAEKEISHFPDNSFDYVILSQTLQAFYQPENVLNELLRIGKKVIISIPNFGYWRVRTSLLFFGKMPVTKSLPDTWYNTPNLHVCSIKDFYQFCDKKKIKMDRIIGINNEKTSSINRINLEMKNLLSEVGIFVIS